MYKKFIITSAGVLKFGVVSRHRDLLDFGEEDCCGGGFWEMDPVNGAVMLFSRSFDFGGPDFSRLTRVDWSTLDGQQHPLVHYPSWPDRTPAIPIL